MNFVSNLSGEPNKFHPHNTKIIRIFQIYIIYKTNLKMSKYYENYLHLENVNVCKIWWEFQKFQKSIRKIRQWSPTKIKIAIENLLWIWWLE